MGRKNKRKIFTRKNSIGDELIYKSGFTNLIGFLNDKLKDMERLHGDIRDFKNYDFELNEKDTKELHRNITIKKQRDEMLEMLQYLNRRGGLGLDIHNKIEQLIKQATELSTTHN